MSGDLSEGGRGDGRGARQGAWQGAWPAAWREEWERNPRLRLGALLAGSLVALWVLLTLADRRDAAVAERDRLSAQVQRLRAVASDPRWEAVAADLRVIDGQWRSRLWREPTEGRMQAALQDWLRTQITAAGLVPRELVASVQPLPAPGEAPPGLNAAEAVRTLPLPEGVRVVRARAAVDMPAQRLHELLALLPAAPGHLRLSRLSVTQADRQTAEFEVEALFTASEPAAGQEAGR